MKIGLIDVDGNNYPNLALMKLSAYHKAQGDAVSWYQPLFSGHMNIVYMSKIFTFSPDYEYFVDADKVIKGGTGYAIKTENGVEVYHKELDQPLPQEVEHIYPDYSLYEAANDTAYGFLTRGCPRGCHFCHVAPKEGRGAYKVADLSEFWRGQSKIVLFDPNILAAADCIDLLHQLADSGATVDFSQGLDIRLMTEEKAAILSKIKMPTLHFAWDRYEDGDIIKPALETFIKHNKVRQHHLMVYCLVGDREKKVLPTDLERIYWLRERGFAPYVMLYDKENVPKGHELRRLQRWVNSPFIFWKTPTFEEYKA